MRILERPRVRVLTDVVTVVELADSTVVAIGTLAIPGYVVNNTGH